jgi:hypothetical protein
VLQVDVVGCDASVSASNPHPVLTFRSTTIVYAAAKLPKACWLQLQLHGREQGDGQAAASMPGGSSAAVSIFGRDTFGQGIPLGKGYLWRDTFGKGYL